MVEELLVEEVLVLVATLAVTAELTKPAAATARTIIILIKIIIILNNKLHTLVSYNYLTIPPSVI